MKFSHKNRFFLFACLSFLLLFAFSAAAQNMQEIKGRMLQRKPTIDSLKGRGIIGEGVDGYLHVRKQAGNAAAVVQAENQDRRAVNGIIAKREGAGVEQVAKKVAQKLINVSPSGHWIRGKDGNWYQK